jgi:hypothetical protein
MRAILDRLVSQNVLTASKERQASGRGAQWVWTISPTIPKDVMALDLDAPVTKT